MVIGPKITCHGPWLSLGKIILIKYEKTFDKEESLVSKTLRDVQNIFVRQKRQLKFVGKKFWNVLTFSDVLKIKSVSLR